MKIKNHLPKGDTVKMSAMNMKCSRAQRDTEINNNNNKYRNKYNKNNNKNNCNYYNNNSNNSTNN